MTQGQTEIEKDWILEITALPVGSFLSEPTMTALLRFLDQSSGSQRRQRGYRVLEFFKAVDWLPVGEIQPNPLKVLSKGDYQRIQSEIQAYLEDKSQKRHSN